MAEAIKMSFGLQAHMGSRNHCVRWKARWRHLVNTLDRSLWWSDVALSYSNLFSDDAAVWLLQALILASKTCGHLKLFY